MASKKHVEIVKEAAERLLDQQARIVELEKDRRYWMGEASQAKHLLELTKLDRDKWRNKYAEAIRNE